MQSLVDCDNPGGAPAHLLSRLAPRIPMFAAAQEPSPNEEMWLKMRLKPKVNWLMLRSLKMWVSEIAALRP